MSYLLFLQASIPLTRPWRRQAYPQSHPSRLKIVETNFQLFIDQIYLSSSVCHDFLNYELSSHCRRGDKISKIATLTKVIDAHTKVHDSVMHFGSIMILFLLINSNHSYY